MTASDILQELKELDGEGIPPAISNLLDMLTALCAVVAEIEEKIDG